MPYKAIRRITKGPHLAYKPDAGGQIKRRESKITTVAQAVKAYLHHTADSADAPLMLSGGMHTLPSRVSFIECIFSRILRSLQLYCLGEMCHFCSAINEWNFSGSGSTSAPAQDVRSPRGRKYVSGHKLSGNIVPHNSKYVSEHK